ncbi:hypothetical protein L345_06179, partial [Ophiophagus hannah]
MQLPLETMQKFQLAQNMAILLINTPMKLCMDRGLDISAIVYSKLAGRSLEIHILCWGSPPLEHSKAEVLNSQATSHYWAAAHLELCCIPAICTMEMCALARIPAPHMEPFPVSPPHLQTAKLERLGTAALRQN